MMAHIYKNTPGFSNAPLAVNDAEDEGDKKPAAKSTGSLLERDRAQGNESIAPSIDIKSVTEVGTIFSVSGSGSHRQPKPHSPGVAAAAKRDEHDDDVIDSKIPARAARQQERRNNKSVNEEDESSDDDSSHVSADDNVARVPSDDEASVSSASEEASIASSASVASLPPLLAAPLLPPTLLSSLNARPLFGQALSQERMTQMMMLSFMQGEIKGMVQRGEIESTSNNADVVAAEYIQNHLSYDEEFDVAVDQVNDSLNMEHFSEAPKVRPRQVAELATAMASLNINGYPTMSEEEAEVERASSTDAEKAAALSDLYGKFYSAETHQSKKSRRDLDERSIDFLIMQMRVEVDMLPVEDKKALLEALVKCHPEEFSNARLLAFLRSEGMNTKLAAIRFANYWDAREELFGPDKFHLRMTLCEALRDDIVALEAGVCTILPYPDLSGRPLFFFEAARNTREGYSPQSLMRAFWYTIEVLVQENKDPDGTFVRILMEKHDSLHHFDCFTVRRAYYYWMHCWPVSNLPRHQCCSSLFMRKVGRPLCYAFMDRASRARVVIHDVPESELLGSLSKYGITANMLPTNMGGLVDLDAWLPRFIVQRRAIEMEEIA